MKKLTFRIAGVDRNFPFVMFRKFRQSECDRKPSGIYSQINKIFFLYCFIITCESYTDNMAVTGEICLIRSEPMRAHCRNTKITWFEILTDDRMIFAEPDHILKEIEQILIFFEETPVQPGDQVILAIRVIISITCVCEFITGEEHWSSAAAKQNGTGIFHQSFTKCQNGRIICFAFYATVPAVIVVSSVSVPPTVGFIMLLVITVQIIKRESIMTGEKVDGSISTSVSRIVQIRRTCDSCCSSPGKEVISF